MSTDTAHTKHATPDHPIADVLKERWSPRAFDDREPDDDTLRSVFEAARWAASSFNGQPWRFIVARRGTALFDRIVETLIGFNQAWAPSAPVLAVATARTTFEHNGKPNAHAWHDIGLAMGNLSAQATQMGLHLHMMAGFKAEPLREALGVPDGFDIVHVTALGYLGSADSLPENMAESERAPRTRKPLDEWVFGDTWGEAASFTQAT